MQRHRGREGPADAELSAQLRCAGGRGGEPSESGQLEPRLSEALGPHPTFRVLSCVHSASDPEPGCECRGGDPAPRGVSAARRLPRSALCSLPPGSVDGGHHAAVPVRLSSLERHLPCLQGGSEEAELPVNLPGVPVP